jgi:protoporphyrinogen oxidase
MSSAVAAAASRSILIVGAGPTGCLTAAWLSRALAADAASITIWEKSNGGIARFCMLQKHVFHLIYWSSTICVAFFPTQSEAA